MSMYSDYTVLEFVLLAVADDGDFVPVFFLPGCLLVVYTVRIIDNVINNIIIKVLFFYYYLNYYINYNIIEL